MKKILFGFAALTIGLVMASCSKSAESSTKSIEALIEEIEENGNDWTDADKWESVMREFVDLYIDFANSEPTLKEYKDFKKAINKFDKIDRKIKDKAANKAMEKAAKAFSKDKDLMKKMEEAQKKLKKHVKKLEKEAAKDDDDDSDNEDDYYDDDDYDDDDY